jgi:hypothetical protein
LRFACDVERTKCYAGLRDALLSQATGPNVGIQWLRKVIDMLNVYVRRLTWALKRFRDDWFNPEWFKPSNLLKELTRPGVRASVARTFAFIVFALLCLNSTAAPFAASIDIEAFFSMLDIEIYLAAALIALPLARLLSAWIKPKTIASLKHEWVILRMCFDRAYEIPESMRIIDRDFLDAAEHW